MRSTTATVRRRVVWWLAGSAVGVALLALPDTGPRLVSLSDDHGPGLVDAIGVAVLVAAWVPIAALLWTQRGSLRGAGARASAGLAVTGLVALVVTIAADAGGWWIAAVVLLVAAQVVALRAVALRSRSASR